jgi:hypothetical protein
MTHVLRLAVGMITITLRKEQRMRFQDP